MKTYLQERLSPNTVTLQKIEASLRRRMDLFEKKRKAATEKAAMHEEQKLRDAALAEANQTTKEDKLRMKRRKANERKNLKKKEEHQQRAHPRQVGARSSRGGQASEGKGASIRPPQMTKSTAARKPLQTTARSLPIAGTLLNHQTRCPSSVHPEAERKRKGEQRKGHRGTIGSPRVGHRTANAKNSSKGFSINFADLNLIGCSSSLANLARLEVDVMKDFEIGVMLVRERRLVGF